MINIYQGRSCEGLLKLEENGRNNKANALKGDEEFSTTDVGTWRLEENS